PRRPAAAPARPAPARRARRRTRPPARAAPPPVAGAGASLRRGRDDGASADGEVVDRPEVDAPHRAAAATAAGQRLGARHAERTVATGVGVERAAQPAVAAEAEEGAARGPLIVLIVAVGAVVAVAGGPPAL